MTREQMVSHLVLLGWEPVEYIGRFTIRRKSTSSTVFYGETAWNDISNNKIESAYENACAHVLK